MALDIPQTVEGKATASSSQFQDVEGVIGIEDAVMEMIAQVGKDDIPIGVGDCGVTGDVVGDGSAIPDLDALLVKKVAFELSEEGFGEPLVCFEPGDGCVVG